MWLIADLMDKFQPELLLSDPGTAILNFIQFWWMWVAFALMVWGLIRFMRWAAEQEREAQDRKYNRQIRRDCR